MTKGSPKDSSAISLVNVANVVDGKVAFDTDSAIGCRDDAPQIAKYRRKLCHTTQEKLFLDAR